MRSYKRLIPPLTALAAVALPAAAAQAAPPGGRDVIANLFMWPWDSVAAAAYTLATVFRLAWEHGTPQVYSGFEFTGYDDSPPSDASGRVTPVTCGSGWQCPHRAPAIRGIVPLGAALPGRHVVLGRATRGSDRAACP